MKKIKTYINFITEKMKLSDLDEKSKNTIKTNIVNKMKEWSSYILDNIEVSGSDVKYKDFDKINSKVMLREFINEFTKEMADELEVEKMIEKISDFMDSKEKDVKKKIRSEFSRFINDVRKRNLK